MPEADSEGTFVRITNVDIWLELQNVKKEVAALNVKFYGVLGVVLAATGAALKIGGVV